MALIYPQEAWERFGPAPIQIHDANGKRLMNVCASDPLTGEVIQNWQPGLYGKDVPLIFRCYALLMRYLWKRWGIESAGEIPRVHWFAPAPLTIKPAA
jgi:hypothetical protein